MQENFSKLMEISEQCGMDLVHPSRELVREGKVTKISASKGIHNERYLFLVMYILCGGGAVCNAEARKNSITLL